MLAFLDESGDPGFKVGQGSSRFFVIALVIFDDLVEAMRCDERIKQLRVELRLDAGFEFHFGHNSRRQRLAFLDAVAPFRFTYGTLVLDKGPEVHRRISFQSKHALYTYACSQVFENARSYLRRATVVIDQSSDRGFRRVLERLLKAQMNEQGVEANIAKVKMERSRSTNLVQLADYVAGITNRYALGKDDAHEYRRRLATREAWFEMRTV